MPHLPLKLQHLLPPQPLMQRLLLPTPQRQPLLTQPPQLLLQPLTLLHLLLHPSNGCKVFPVLTGEIKKPRLAGFFLSFLRAASAQETRKPVIWDSFSEVQVQ